MTFIHLESVSYEVRGKKILTEINVKLKKDEIVALTGPNGAGKTTLSKIMMGVLENTSGSVWIDGVDINEMKLHEVGRKIGYLFQNPTHQIFMPTVEEELSFSMKYNRVDEEKINSSVIKMMEVFNLSEISNNLTYHLSQGEKQRLALATILLNSPEYLILDEPFKGLDTKHKKDLSDYLKVINESGVGLMIITHDADVIESMADRLISMEGGTIDGDTFLRS